MFKRIALVLLILLILGLAALAGGYYAYNSMLEPVDPEADNEFRIVDIPSGANLQDIAGILHREELIRSPLVFRLYIYRQGTAGEFIAGTYRLSPSMSAEEIAAVIRAGDVYAETVWFTIPEGYTVEQMADRLEENQLIDRDLFLELARRPSQDIIESFPQLEAAENPEIDYLLEGYLFPDTYEVTTDTNAEAVIKLMLGRMDRVIEEKYKQRMDEQELSLHETLTIASLIEREARVAHERALIAGVIYNRLEIGQLLQIDATIQYILGETREFLTYEDLEIPSPYNTYLHEGLPPGPIAAPGEAAIEAALHPEDTAYYYYNYKYDDSGEHYFSHTFDEHQVNVRRAEENLRNNYSPEFNAD